MPEGPGSSVEGSQCKMIMKLTPKSQMEARWLRGLAAATTAAPQGVRMPDWPP